MAAAMGNVDERDSWKVHFADTMRGGQYINNWRMAELHAQEAPDRVRELEAWGAAFDRTKDGKILQRNFGGHRYPRLAHVGDRTGLELIRTLQDHGIHQGMEVHMEVTIVRLLKDGDRIAGARRLHPRPRAVRGVPRPARWCWPPAASGGPTRSPPTAGSAPATATPWPTTPGPSCRTWSSSSSTPPAWSGRRRCKGILVTEGVRGEGGVLLNSERQALHVRRHPRQLQEPDGGQPRRGLALHPGGQERAPPARAADPRPRRPLYQPRGEGRAGQPPRRRVPRHLLDQGEAPRRRRAHQEEAALDVPPVQEAGGPRHHHRRRWRSAPPPTT